MEKEQRERFFEICENLCTAISEYLSFSCELQNSHDENSSIEEDFVSYRASRKLKQLEAYFQGKRQ